MRKLIASSTIAASIIGGGAGAIILGPALAGAQETTNESPADDDGLEAVLAELVTEGIIDQDQADAVATALREAHADGRLRRLDHHRPFGGGEVLEELGIDRETVRSGLAEGLTLGEIADANGSSAEELATALEEEMGERIDSALENGRIDEDRAVELREGIAERVDSIVNGESTFGWGRHRHLHRHGDRFGADESTDDADA